MNSKKTNMVKLGVFSLAGISFLILLLYVIGKNQNLFGKTFELKARFENVYGLMPGNNIRFAGIDAGTVDRVEVLNDTSIEVTLLVKNKMKAYIHRNAAVTIGTDGFIGNKVVNIEPAKTPAPLVTEGDVLYGQKSVGTDEIIQTLSKATGDIVAIAAGLRQTVDRINNSKVVWRLLDDESLPLHVRQSLEKINHASGYMNQTAADLSRIVGDVQQGKGTLGQLVKDTSITAGVKESLEKIKNIGIVADSLAVQISTFVATISQEVNGGKGTIHTLLKDEELAQRLNNTMKNIEQDTRSFNEVMEGLKHSFLLRGYFKKLEKQKQAQGTTAGKY